MATLIASKENVLVYNSTYTLYINFWLYYDTSSKTAYVVNQPAGGTIENGKDTYNYNYSFNSGSKGSGTYQWGSHKTSEHETWTLFTSSGTYEEGETISVSFECWSAHSGSYIDMSGSVPYTYRNVSLSSQGSASSPTGGGDKQVGSTVTIDCTVPSNNSTYTYTFNGWYYSDNSLFNSSKYCQFTMPANDLSLYCKATASYVNYTISTGTSGNYTCSVSGAGSSYHYGDSVTVTASMASSTGVYTYTFNGWYEGSTKVSSSASYTFKCTGNRSLTASASVSYTSHYVTISPGANIGSITGASSGNYNYGDNLTLTAVPQANTAQYTYSFLKWTRDGSDVSTSNPASIQVTGANTISAIGTATVNSYTISTSSTGYSVTVSGAGTYKYGDSVTLTASIPTTTKQYTYTFNGWYENNTLVSTDNPYKFTCTGARTVTANTTQTLNSYYTTTSAGDSYISSITGGNATKSYGTQLKLEATPATNTAKYAYYFRKWTKDGSEFSDQYSNPLYVTVDDAHTYTAYGKALINGYDIALSANNDGYIKSVTYNPESETSPGAYFYDDVVTLTATPADKTIQYTYTFDHWTKDGKNYDGGNAITITVDGNHAFIAYGKRTVNRYTITVDGSAEGIETVSGGGTYDYGKEVTLRATVKDGYGFDYWQWTDEDGTIKTSKSNPLTVTVTGVNTADRTYTPVLTNEIFNVTFNYNEDEVTNVYASDLINPEITSDFTYGHTIVLHATPKNFDTGYGNDKWNYFDYWSGDVTSNIARTLEAQLVITNNLTITYNSYELFAYVYHKESGTWYKKKFYIKDNGKWITPRRIYIKKNGKWEEALIPN